MRKLSILLVGLTLFWFSQFAVAANGKVLQDLCSDSRYFCTQVQKGETWESLFSDSTLRRIVMQVNRINIQLRTGMVIAVPKDLGVIALNDLSPFGKNIEAKGEPVLIYDPALLAWGAFDASGQLIRWGAGAAGSDWCRDIGRACHTTVGEHRVYRIGSANCASRTYPLPDGGAPMPYCMFFSGGEAFHGAREVPGYNASHGCVRLFVDDAAWLHGNFVTSGRTGTLVVIKPYYQKPSTIWDEEST
jgi:hypothetical protein